LYKTAFAYANTCDTYSDATASNPNPYTTPSNGLADAVAAETNCYTQT
jgi:hypothetical protein